MRKLIRRILATLRLSDQAVCEESADMGLVDYHDYPDSTNNGMPWHFIKHTCKRCGKRFTI